jgi:superfamily II RNA helicase
MWYIEQQTQRHLIKTKYEELKETIDTPHNDLIKLANQLKYYDNIIQENLDVCINFLQNNDFIDNDNKLTELGKCAIFVGDSCNPLMLAKIIQSIGFKKLSPNEMIIALSFMCDNNYSEEIYNPSNNKIKLLFDQISEINLKLINDLNKLEIIISSDWEITCNNCDIVEDWLNKKPYEYIYKTYQTYEGNIVKNMIKLSNIVNSTVIYYKSSGQIEMADKLSSFEEIIVRDIVNCESIYLSIK